MHRPGHYGASLIGYAPIAAVLIATGYDLFAVLGLGLTLVLAMVPDWDQRIPFIAHRGITHTLWAALGIGGVIGWLAFALFTPAPLATVAGVVFGTTAAVSILSHIAADACTRMGVTPFIPLVRARYRIPFYILPFIKNPRASNPIVNYLFLVVGIVAIVGALVAGTTFRGGALPVFSELPFLP